MKFDVTTRSGRAAARCWPGRSRPSPPSLAMAAIAGAARRAANSRRTAKPSTTDPRVGLKPGRTDAGVAAKNMTLVSSMAQAGRVLRSQAARRATSTPPEPPAAPAAGGRSRAGRLAAPAAPAAANGAPAAPAAPAVPAGGGNFLAFANSDLAFKGVQRRDGQLPRLQHLQRRGRAAAASWWPRSPARAARATSRSTATCCSCRSSRRAAGSTAAPRAWPPR